MPYAFYTLSGIAVVAGLVAYLATLPSYPEGFADHIPSLALMGWWWGAAFGVAALGRIIEMLEVIAGVRRHHAAPTRQDTLTLPY